MSFKEKRAFTLVELMAAMVMLIILGMLAMPLAKVVYLREKEEMLKEVLIETRDAIDKYYRDHGFYPKSWQDLFFDPYLQKPYLRHSPPINPFTKDIYGWVVICSPVWSSEEGRYIFPTYPMEKFLAFPTPLSGIYDIRCKKPEEDKRRMIPKGVALDGKTFYWQW